MFYRVIINLAFEGLTNPNKIKALAQGLLNQAVVIHPGEANQETGYILVEECYHDENPPKPCKELFYDESTP